MADQLVEVRIRSVFAQYRKPGQEAFRIAHRNDTVEVTQEEADRLEAAGATYGSDPAQKDPEGGPGITTNESSIRPRAVDDEEHQRVLGLDGQPVDPDDVEDDRSNDVEAAAETKARSRRKAPDNAGEPDKADDDASAPEARG